MARKKPGLRKVVSREISRASKRARPETDHWKGLNAVLTKTKKKMSGPVPPPAHIEVSTKAPASPHSNRPIGKLVRRHSRG